MATPIYICHRRCSPIFSLIPPPPHADHRLRAAFLNGAWRPLPPDTQARGRGRGRLGPSASATPRRTTPMATHRCGHLRRRSRRRHRRRRRGNDDGGGSPRLHCGLIEMNDVPDGDEIDLSIPILISNKLFGTPKS